MTKAETMPDTRTTAIAIRTETQRAAGLLQAINAILARAGAWATGTAQEFGALVAALMGPAVLSGYALAAWSLASNFGWTGSFLFNSGPLSNWLVWLAIAILVNTAASILRRRTRQTN
jgi:hypothetical protein